MSHVCRWWALESVLEFANSISNLWLRGQPFLQPAGDPNENSFPLTQTGIGETMTAVLC